VPDAPRISIVIPIYNEEAILHAAVVDLRERLKPLGWSYEVILAENGSRDRTVEIGQELANKYGRGGPEDGQVKIISLGEPNYGKALKQGILLCATRTSIDARWTSSRAARPISSSDRSSSRAPRTTVRRSATRRASRTPRC
jgi:glycosyltransferase involved in cell wall biosynthesis